MNTLNFYSSTHVIKDGVRINILSEVTMLSFKVNRLYLTIIKLNAGGYSLNVSVDGKEKVHILKEEQFKQFIDNLNKMTVNDAVVKLMEVCRDD